MRPSRPQAEIKIPAAMRAAMRVAITMNMVIVFVLMFMDVAIVAMAVTVGDPVRSGTRNSIAFSASADSAHDSCSLLKRDRAGR